MFMLRTLCAWSLMSLMMLAVSPLAAPGAGAATRHPAIGPGTQATPQPPSATAVSTATAASGASTLAMRIELASEPDSSLGVPRVRVSDRIHLSAAQSLDDSNRSPHNDSTRRTVLRL
jgi:hypothetical protein